MEGGLQILLSDARHRHGSTAVAPVVGTRVIRARKIDHLVLGTGDLDTDARFYCDGLGSAVERRQADIGRLQLRAGSSPIGRVPVDGTLGRVGDAAPEVIPSR